MYNLRDFKRAWIIYQTIKKGEEKMDKAKAFIKDHSREILIAVGFLASYQIGFKNGFKKGIKFEDALIKLSRGGK